jgi:hypothetical protein
MNVSNTGVDLHVHLLQSLFPADIFALARDVYREINWNRFRFLESFEKVYGYALDPIGIFKRAIAHGSLQELTDVMTYGEAERGNFNKFNIKSFFPLCVTGYYLDKGDFTSVIAPIIQRHKAQGISYIEYRQAVGYSDEVKDEWKAWHRHFIQYIKDACTPSFQARYIMRITDNAFGAVQEFLLENPQLAPWVVGLDFTGKETPPKSHRQFFQDLQQHNRTHPHLALDAVVHIGEVFFDKSLESAIRWCHEMVLLGARRLGHCLACGLDPAIAISRRQDAHQSETIAQRLDQIAYDLSHQDALRHYGVPVDVAALKAERQTLECQKPDTQVTSTYDANRLENVRKRQAYVLDAIQARNVIVEVCPTSNLRIGAIPDFSQHPFHRFSEAGIPMAICTDDPGVFGVTLKDEIDLVAQSCGISETELQSRLGMAHEYRLSKERITS